MPFEKDKHGLIIVLTIVRDLFPLLCENITDAERRARFRTVLNEAITPMLDEVIHEINNIASADNSKWKRLAQYGLTDISLQLKLAELFDWLTKGKIRNFIKGLNSLLASLFKVFAQLDAVKEFKDILEIRLDDDHSNDVPPDDQPDQTLERVIHDAREALDNAREATKEDFKEHFQGREGQWRLAILAVLPPLIRRNR